MSDKIGILTFHRALSYGANLQAYGLQNFMFKLGIDNEIVDYRCKYMIEHYQKVFRKTKGNKLKGFAWNLLSAKSVIQKKKNTTDFVEKHLNLSHPYDENNIKEANNLYRAFVTGSDQVWSPTCVGFDPVYFLTFADSAKKYSYAASIATDTIPENLKDEFIRRVSDFSSCSLREKSGANLVKNLSGKDAFVSIDPSMLLKREDWDKLCSDNAPNEPYILLFTVPKPKNLVNYALELAEKHNCKVLFLNNFSRKIKHERLTYIDPVSNNDFISLIKNAKYVCTNSFHGNAFSLLYHKNFVVETDTLAKKNIRSESLMLSLGLKSRILSTENKPDIDDNTDWDKIDRLIDEERERSKKYLLGI